MRINHVHAGVALLLCAALLASCSQPSNNQEIVTGPAKEAKVLHLVVEETLTSPQEVQLQAAVNRVGQISDSMLQIEIVTPEQAEQADIRLLSNAQLAKLDGLFAMFSMPFIYDDPSHMTAALNSPEMLERLSQNLSEAQLLPLAALYSGDHCLVTDWKELRRPADFKGSSMAIESKDPRIQDVFGALGVQNMLQSDATEKMLHTSFSVTQGNTKPKQDGEIDTVEISLQKALLLPEDFGTLYLTLTHHAISPLWVVADINAMNELNDFERACLFEGLSGLLGGWEQSYSTREQLIYDQLTQRGVSIVESERATITSALYGSGGTGTERYKPPTYFDSKIYKLIQTFS